MQKSPAIHFATYEYSCTTCEARAAARMGAELLIRLDLSEKQNQRVARNMLAATMRVGEILSDLALLLTGAANHE